MATYKQIEKRTEEAYNESLRSGEGYGTRLKKFTQFLASRRVVLMGAPELLGFVVALWGVIRVLSYYLIGLPLSMIALILAPISIFVFDSVRVHAWERVEDEEAWADAVIDEARNTNRRVLPRREDFVPPDEIED